MKPKFVKMRKQISSPEALQIFDMLVEYNEKLEQIIKQLGAKTQ